MPKRVTAILLGDISEALEKIQRYLGTLTREQFLADDKTIDAVVRNLEIIGEAAKNLPQDFRDSHTSVSWSQMAGLRNRIVHDYAGIDLEMIWEIVSVALVKFRVELDQIQKG